MKSIISLILQFKIIHLIPLLALVLFISCERDDNSKKSAECSKLYSDTLTAYGTGMVTENYSFDINLDTVPDIEFIVISEYGHIQKTTTTIINPLDDQWKIYSNEVVYSICQDTLEIPGNSPAIYYETTNCINNQMPMRKDTHNMVNLHESSDPENVIESQTINGEVVLYNYDKIYHSTLFPNAEQREITKSAFGLNMEGWIILENMSGDQYGIKVKFDNLMKNLTVNEIKKLDCN